MRKTYFIGFSLHNLDFKKKMYIKNNALCIYDELLYFAQYLRQSGFPFGRPGARLTKAYDVTIPRYPNSRAKLQDSKIHIMRCMGSKFCVKFQWCSWKFHPKF